MDDAALSCGQLLGTRPGSHVVTVFSSGPASVRPLPEWDQKSGFFRPGDDVMAVRQIEDDDAMAVVGAHGHRLDFWDLQYRGGPPVRLARLRPEAARARQDKIDGPDVERAVSEKLQAMVTGLAVETWFVPLGLWHRDHKITARACLRVARALPDRRWVLYEELPYRLEVPQEVLAGKQGLESEGFGTEPAAFPSGSDNAQKDAMVRCYRSQLPCLGDRARQATVMSESFHLLTDRLG
jgi:LmbE family N-acetylglucosaminyl deacetylase